MVDAAHANKWIIEHRPPGKVRHVVLYRIASACEAMSKWAIVCSRAKIGEAVRTMSTEPGFGRRESLRLVNPRGEIVARLVSERHSGDVMEC